MHNKRGSSSDAKHHQSPSVNLISQDPDKVAPGSSLEQFRKSSSLDPDLHALALEVWRLERRLAKSTELKDVNAKALQNSVTKLKKTLDKHRIEVRDYTGEKYSEGMTVDVISVEQDENQQGSVIKETFEPAVIQHDKMIKPAKVIVLKGAA